jgi:opacity protein-like surface antigen
MEKNTMKKIILAAAAVLALVSTNVFADYKWYASGNVGYNFDNTKDGAENSDFGLGASVGYIINDKSDVSIGLNFGSAAEKGINDSGNPQDISTSATEISLGYEYLLGSKGDFSFYLWGGFAYTLINDENKLTDEKWEGQSYGISIVPNVQYAVTERIVFGVDLNFLSLDYYVTTGDDDYENTAFGINASTTATAPVTLYFSFLF